MHIAQTPTTLVLDITLVVPGWLSCVLWSLVPTKPIIMFLVGEEGSSLQMGQWVQEELFMY